MFALILIVLLALGLTLSVMSLTGLAVGLLGESGVIRAPRCPTCGHLSLQTSGSATTWCPTCQHVHLAHPVRTLRHPIHEFSRH